jgi:glycogen synthase
LLIEQGLLDAAESLASTSANVDHSVDASLWLVPGKLRSRIESQTTIIEKQDTQNEGKFKEEFHFCYETDCHVPFGNPDGPHRPKHRVRIFRFTEKNGEQWILFDAKEFFNADGGSTKDDPYVYSDETGAERDGEESRLLRDSLFASRAVPEVLKALGKTRNVIVHAQDWEFAAAALTVKEAICDDDSFESAAVVLTLHNPFDHSLSTENLKKITDRWADELWPVLDDGETCHTVLTRMIPLVDAPISTVSRVFAVEFQNHPLQTGHFARHYQKKLDKQKIVGIDNGIFEALRTHSANDRQAINEAMAGDPTKILAAKREARRIMLNVLERFLDQHKERISGTLQGVDEGPLHDLPDEIPVFLMVGRLDPGQKGFDLLIRAVERIPAGTARFVISPLSPLSSDEKIGKYLADLKRVANQRPDVVIAPFRLQGEIDGHDVYPTIRAGVTWSVWPSLYEPFGGVTEMYIHGTPVVAHDQGGLRQQVRDIERDGEEKATGIVFRAPGDNLKPDTGGLRGDDQRRRELELEHRKIQDTNEPPDRMQSSLYSQQVESLSAAITQACETYRDRPDQYGRILANLPEMAEKISWDIPVRDYRQWYDKACEDTSD